ncbi:hypothetical protein HPG69_008645 [Diceros bicornis minor]|uniref:Uncharacterized protein n=1 Tax=Diceros bicornis minor TaxID=77932 RepID=A0A7J7FAF1_DICBM|nr:hypothetical protein HPG69_008645 [Diceros bicornis minor]
MRWKRFMEQRTSKSLNWQKGSGKTSSILSINFKDPQFAEDYIFKAIMLPGARKPTPVLKPSDWEKSSNGRQWKPQLGFNRDRRPVHLDQAAFRTLGHVMPRGSGAGVYSTAAPPPAPYQGNLYRPLLRGQAQIPKLMSSKFLLIGYFAC